MTTRLGPAQMAEVLTVQAGDKLRSWRGTRNATAPEVLPGLCDGLLVSFFDLLGPLLARGAPPEDVASSLSGVLRLPPEGAEPIVESEWHVARLVLHGTCASLGASRPVEDWLDAAAAGAQAASARAARGDPGALPRAVVVRVYSGTLLRPRG